MDKPLFTIIDEKSIPGSAKEFVVEVSAETLEKYRASALTSLTSKAELPGFRKGKAPEALVEKETGSMKLLEKAADTLIHDVVVSVLSEKKLSFIGRPHITLTMLARGNPLKFTMRVSVVPEVSLPNYKEIAQRINQKKEPDIAVTETEIKEALERVRALLASGSTDKNALPELSNDNVKRLGNFASVEDFKQRLTLDLQNDKKRKQAEKRKLELIEAVIEQTKIDMPEALIEHELERMEAEFSADITRLGMKMDDYLKKISKTIEELRKEWRVPASKRAALELIVPRIAKAENITFPSQEVEGEVKHLLKHHTEADAQTAKLYVERMLLHRKVIELLERQ